MASEDTPTTEQTATEQTATEQTAPVRRTGRRRATSTTATPTHVEAGPEALRGDVPPQPDADQAPGAGRAPKKAKKGAAEKAGGKAAGKATKTAAAKRGVADAEAADMQAADMQAADTQAADMQAPAPETAPEPVATKAATARARAKAKAKAKAAPSEDEAVPAATFDPGSAAAVTASSAPAGGGSLGLVFQAPDPSAAPRRRRATAPVQAPTADVDSGDERPEPAPSDGRRGRDRAEAAVEDVADDGAEDRADARAEDRGGESGDQDESAAGPRRRRRGGRGRRGRAGSDGEAGGPGSDEDAGDGADSSRRRARSGDADLAEQSADEAESSSSRRRRRRRRGGAGDDGDNPPGTVTRVRAPRKDREEPTAVKGSTRLEAKKQRRREGREAGRRRTIITEAEFLARRESVERVMVVRGVGDRTQIGVLEDGVLVEHYVSRETTASMAGNVYLGRVQNVLPSMEAAFVDIGKGRNAVLYAGEVNWDAAGLESNAPKRIENALSSGDTVLVQVTKDPIGHKGARLTSQISLPGRYLVYVPEGSMTGISRKLPDTERARLKAILKEVVPDTAGVIVRTAAEGASEEELRADVERLTKAWEAISKRAKTAAAKKASAGGAPQLLHGEPDLTVRVIRDVFTEDFTSLIVSGEGAWAQVGAYIGDVAPDLADRVTRWTAEQDVFGHYRIDEQLAKAMDRKVWLPSGGSLVIDRTEAMTVIDVNTGKFVGSGGNLEETVTKNNIEAAEEIVRQLRLRDIGGIIVIDFIDMVLESNRDLVVRRLLECLGRDRTKHQVAEVTSLGLVQMTRKRVGSGLIEVFSEACDHCNGRGIIIHTEPVTKGSSGEGGSSGGGSSRSRSGKRSGTGAEAAVEEAKGSDGPTAAQIAAAAHAAAIKRMSGEPIQDDVAELGVDALAEEPVESEPVVEPPVRTRRRRGRGVAPAGPPRTSSGPDGAAPAPEPAATGEEAPAAESAPEPVDEVPADLPTDAPAEPPGGTAEDAPGEEPAALSTDLADDTPDR